MKKFKKLSQFFLKNNRILKLLAESLGDIHNYSVIEIGGGTGNLTKFLTKAKRLIVYEIDKNLSFILENKFKNYKNVEILNEDFLKADLSKYKNNYYLIGNIPYHITGKILRKIFSLDNPKVAVLLLQKEYGEKILGIPRNNFLKWWVYNFSEVRKISIVKRKNFFPSPQVDSIALKFVFRKKPLISDIKNFEFFLKNMFSHSNRTIYNNLKKINLDKSLFKNFNDLLTKRPHQLNFEEIVRLSKLNFLKNV
jgi:16S rRNA (adenine1518-N6/adenine1519-N6)-dimethyltransferase